MSSDDCRTDRVSEVALGESVELAGDSGATNLNKLGNNVDVPMYTALYYYSGYCNSDVADHSCHSDT